MPLLVQAEFSREQGSKRPELRVFSVLSRPASAVCTCASARGRRIQRGVLTSHEREAASHAASLPPGVLPASDDLFVPSSRTSSPHPLLIWLLSFLTKKREAGRFRGLPAQRCQSPGASHQPNPSAAPVVPAGGCPRPVRCGPSPCALSPASPVHSTAAPSSPRALFCLCVILSLLERVLPLITP